MTCCSGVNSIIDPNDSLIRMADPWMSLRLNYKSFGWLVENSWFIRVRLICSWIRHYGLHCVCLLQLMRETLVCIKPYRALWSFRVSVMSLKTNSNADILHSTHIHSYWMLFLTGDISQRPLITALWRWTFPSI